MTTRICLSCAKYYYITIGDKVVPLLKAWPTLEKSTGRCLVCGVEMIKGKKTFIGRDYFHFESDEAKKHGVHGLLPALYGKSPAEITAYYRSLIKEQRRKLISHGLNIVMADTDSVWATVAHTKSAKGQEAEGK